MGRRTTTGKLMLVFQNKKKLYALNEEHKSYGQWVFQK